MNVPAVKTVLKSTVLPIGFLFALSFAAALFGFGRSYQAKVTPQSGAAVLADIRSDGWVTDGAVVPLPHLASKGNRLILELDPWRPTGLEPAKMRVFVCGELRGEFEVHDTSPKQLSLEGDCVPREVKFEVLNPFSGSESDTRQKGAKLIQLTVGSRLGVPLVDFNYLLSGSLAIFFVGACLLSILKNSSAKYLAMLVPLASFLILSRSEGIDLRTEYPLWLFIAALVFGAWVASQLNPRELRVPDEGNTPLGAFKWILILALVAGAGAMRFYGLNFGFPANFHPDEVPKVNAIMRMVDAGDLNPRYFLHPSLLLYSSYFTNTLFHFFGMDGTFRETAFLAGRTVSATAGTLSVLLVFLVGRRLFGTMVGFSAAIFLAVFPLHVTCSRYMKEDALLVFWVLACTWMTLKSVQQNRKWMLLIAGVFGGLAAGTKYPGLLTFCIVASAPWLSSKRLMPDWRWMFITVAAIAVIPLTFIATTPYSIITPDKFLKDFRSEQHHMERGHTITIDPWSQLWMYHFSRSLLPGMSTLCALLGTAGIGLLLWRRRIEDLFVVCLVILYYFPAEWVKAKPEPQPERYVMPCLPILAITLSELFRVLSRSRVQLFAPLVFLVALAFPALRSWQISSEIKHDTRDVMAQWILENIPPGSKIGLDWKPYSPPLLNKGYEITFIPRATILERLRVKDLKASGLDYLVLSSLFYDRYFTQPHPHATLRQLFRDLWEQVPVVREVQPAYGTYGFHNPRLTLFSLKEEDFAKLDTERLMKREGKIAQTSNEMRAAFKWALR